VQVDRLNPVLKVPGAKRLKLKYNEVVSTFAFKFDLRHYTKESTIRDDLDEAGGVLRTIIRPTLNLLLLFCAHVCASTQCSWYW